MKQQVLPPEEQFLINRFTAVPSNWRKRLDCPFEIGAEEEVGENGGEFGEPV
ncbi:MAG: hypothetical protein U9M97_04015 [Candidatus Hadarchaeota archaeon]|nr:hypothetical protein [Candidatus Hadarchaeota archaeon]